MIVQVLYVLLSWARAQLKARMPRSQQVLDDADNWAQTISPTQILSQIGSPFSECVDPTVDQAIADAPNHPGSILECGRGGVPVLREGRGLWGGAFDVDKTRGSHGLGY